MIADARTLWRDHRARGGTERANGQAIKAQGQIGDPVHFRITRYPRFTVRREPGAYSSNYHGFSRQIAARSDRHSTQKLIISPLLFKRDFALQSTFTMPLTELLPQLSNYMKCMQSPPQKSNERL